MCAEADPEVLVLMARHRLYDDCLWRSPASISAEATAQARFDAADDIAGWDQASVAKRLRLRRDGLRLANIAEHHEARCSLRELLSPQGKHLEGRDAAELASAEAGIISGAKNIEHKLNKLREFDMRREWAHDAEDIDPRALSGAGWMRRVL